MTAAPLNLRADQSRNVNETWTWFADSLGSEPVNLAGYSAHMQVRMQRSPQGALLADFSTAAGTLQLGGAAGTITWAVPGAQTAGWDWVRAYYDLEVTDPAGNPTGLLAGTLTVNPAVTVD